MEQNARVCLSIHFWIFDSLNCQLIKHPFNNIWNYELENYNLIIILTKLSCESVEQIVSKALH